MSKKNIITHLKAALADSYVLSLKTQNFHWNVTGANFISLHELFGAQYEELSAAIDELAERIRALGEHAPGSFRDFLEITSIDEAEKKSVSAPEMLKQLVKDHQLILKTLNTALQAFDEAGDVATVDMLTVRIEAHDKHKWMLQSSL